MAEARADLRLAADAGDAAHEAMQLRRRPEPAARLAFVEAAVEDELHLESAQRRRGLEHLALAPGGAVPAGGAACRGGEREDQPAAAGSRPYRRHGPDRPQECPDCLRLARGGQLLLAVVGT